MRKAVLYTMMSLDGDVDDPGRYFTPDEEAGLAPEFDAVMIEIERRVIDAQDTALLGRHCTTSGRAIDATGTFEAQP